jgi:Cft2 family RNA processing exonuclease
MSLAVEYCCGGVRLPELGLWLDPHRSQRGEERVFVSHAHSDHIGSHREVILTPATARFMQARLKGDRIEHCVAFGQPTRFSYGQGSYEITLLPAGHIFGSAMALIEAKGCRLLYTGDFKLAAGLAAEVCQPCPADILVMETTFGRPEYQFPPTSGVVAELLRFCQESLAGGQTPVLLGYSLGKSQDLLLALAGAGLPIMVHEQVARMTRLCEELGLHFPPFQIFEPAAATGKVLIFPPSAKLPALPGGKGFRTAVATGWAIERSCRYRYGVDAAFPLSDHAGFAELMEFARRVAPDRIYTLHGFAADFAQSLRDLGFDAWALSEPDQLHLRL